MSKRKKNNRSNNFGLTEKDLKVYDYLSLAFGISSLVLSITGIFGILFGIFGICIGDTYYICTKKFHVGFLLSMIGSLLSAFVLAYYLYLAYI